MLLEITNIKKVLKKYNISLKSINKLLDKYGIENKNISISAKIANVDNKIIIEKDNLEYVNELNKLKKILEYYKSYKELEEKFIASNIRLVISIAKKYVGRGVEFLDLIQHGNIGLKRAFDRYDINKECKFSTYATWCIRKEVIRCLQNLCTTIRIPENIYEIYYRISLAERELEHKLFRFPKDEEIVEHLKKKQINISITTLHNIKKYYQPTLSLDVCLEDDSENTVLDLIEEPKNNIEEYLNEESLKELLGRLTLKERIVLILRYSLKLNNYMSYNDFYNLMIKSKNKYSDKLCEKLYKSLSIKTRIYTLKEIGDLFDVTSESIRLNELSAFNKLKKYTLNQKVVYLY